MSGHASLGIVTIGPKGCGKSTLAGQLRASRVSGPARASDRGALCTRRTVYKSGSLDDRTLEAYEKEANDMGRGSSKFAWALDQTEAERASGQTIDNNTVRFETPKYDVALIDTPGDARHLKNAIRGISQADIALVVIPADVGGFEACLSKTDSPLRDHIYAASSCGTKQVIVAVTKLDAVFYTKERYDEICHEMQSLLRKVSSSTCAHTHTRPSGPSGRPLPQRFGVILLGRLASGACGAALRNYAAATPTTRRAEEPRLRFSRWRATSSRPMKDRPRAA
jgi:translation elongation factor EF-1alpha